MLGRSPPQRRRPSSPPQTPGSIVSPIRHTESEPNITTMKGLNTERKKRKHDGVENSMSDTLREMFVEFSVEQSKNFNSLQSVVNTIKEQNVELTKSVDMMSSKYDEFLARITALEQKGQEDQQYINVLEEKIEVLERKSRAAGIELHIPKFNRGQKPETKDELLTIVKSLGTVVNLDIQDADIRDIFRPFSKDTQKPIIAELSSVIKKEKLIYAVKSFNKGKNKGEKLNTNHLNLDIPVQPVFVAETLTQKQQRLFYLARKFAADQKYDFCWTVRGVVYLRKKETAPQIRVDDSLTLEDLRKQKWLAGAFSVLTYTDIYYFTANLSFTDSILLYYVPYIKKHSHTYTNTLSHSYTNIHSRSYTNLHAHIYTNLHSFKRRTHSNIAYYKRLQLLICLLKYFFITIYSYIKNGTLNMINYTPSYKIQFS